MLIVIVYVHVKENCIEEFKVATIENASKSIHEAGIHKFDFIQQNDDPTRFILMEVYTDEDATLAHKETAHYKKWKENVAEMMAEPRVGVRYHEIYPLLGS